MKIIQTDAKLVIEYDSWRRDREKRVKDCAYELRRLEKELRGHNFLGGFASSIEGVYTYACEHCGAEHEERSLIYKCEVCGKEVCDSCGWGPLDTEGWMCDDCHEIHEAAYEAAKDVNDGN